MPTVHGATLSPFVRKLLAFLTIKGLPYEIKPVFPGSPDEAFRKISPLGKIPAYSDGDLAVSDSSVICAYLERLHPDPPLYPADPAEYARALWLEEYADTKLAENVGGKIFFPRVVLRKMMKKEHDEEKVLAAIADDLPPVLEYLEGQLGDGDYAVGNAPSIADLAIVSHFINLDHAGVSVDSQRWPTLVRYLAKHCSSPYFKQFIEEDRLQLGS